MWHVGGVRRRAQRDPVVVAADQAVGRRTVILAEDWHTGWPLIAVHEELVRRRLRNSALLAWTANNRFGFDRIDFARLGAAATLLTISRAMKHLMWQYGVNPLVVPNGIPDEFIDDQPDGDVAALRRVFQDRRVGLAKLGAGTPTSGDTWPSTPWPGCVTEESRLCCWPEAGTGVRPHRAHHRELRSHASQLGPDWAVCTNPGSGERDLAAAIGRDAPVGSGGARDRLPSRRPELAGPLWRR